MDVWRITIAALRRWYVLLPLLALTAVGVMMSGSQAAPEYEAEASAMVAPERQVAEEVYNPYGSVSGAQQALSIILNSADARQQIADRGLEASYEIGAESRSSIFQLAVRSADATVARDTARAVIDLAADELKTRQDEAGLDEESQYTIDVLAAPALVGVVETSQLRTQAVIGALGVGLSVLIAVLFDDIIGLLRRSRVKRRRNRAAAATDDDHPGQLTLGDIPGVDAALVGKPVSRPEPGVQHPSPSDRDQPHLSRRAWRPLGHPMDGSLLADSGPKRAEPSEADNATPADGVPAVDESDDEAPTDEPEARESVPAGTRQDEPGQSDSPRS